MSHCRSARDFSYATLARVLCLEFESLNKMSQVCTLGGVPLYADAWGIDAIYSGSQKVLGAPPGEQPKQYGSAWTMPVTLLPCV